MKSSLLILIFCLISLGANAQTMPDTSVQNQYQFVPMKVELSNFALTYNPVRHQQSKLLKSTGWLLYGLKFSSAVDEFNAIAPFDQRAINPTSVSNFNLSLSRSYLLLNTHPSFYDR